MSEPTIEDCIEDTFGGILVPNKHFDRLSAELARLRAEARRVAELEDRILQLRSSDAAKQIVIDSLRPQAEAWRAVREKHETQVWNRDYIVSKEVDRQIARLDQLQRDQLTPKDGGE